MKRILFSSLVLVSILLNAQELKLPRLFSNGAVLQRDIPVRFWGWAGPGEKVTVSIDGFDISTKADMEGKWESLYPAHPAGGPFEVNVNSVILSDIYFGDVWIAGGQSNMEWQIGAGINNMEAELMDTDYPQIRFFKVDHDISTTPLDDLDNGEWKVANPENAKNFSAVAWFFAKRNHLEKNVPVGVISSNWGGTPAESWVSAERLLSIEGYKESAAEMLDSKTDWDQVMKENGERNTIKYQRVEDQTEFLKYGAHLPEFDDSGWAEMKLPNKEALVDFVWLRKSVELKSVKDAQLSFGNPGKFSVVFINGVKVYTKIWSDDPRVVDIDKGILKKGKNVIAIRTVEDWDNRTFIGEAGEFWIKAGKETVLLEGTWKFSNAIEPPMPEVRRYEHSPGMLYNSMINPLAGYSLKGAIWYQGESNAGKPELYKDLFVALIEDWRIKWKQDRFPFIYAQLANWQKQYDYPTESNWAALQEAQTQTLELANTGMACIIDVGEARDIHPKNKQDVGTRMWLAARKVAYGEDLVYSGPMYKSHKIDVKTAIVEFDFVGRGLKIKGDKVVGFAIAGADKKFVWADARIDGNKVVLSSEKISSPVYIRYAWADNPACNLYNEEGLPAVPFRTDR